MKPLNSFGVSRLASATSTVKIEQLVAPLTWRQAKRKLKELSKTGLITLHGAQKNRLELLWEPRVFPGLAIKPAALEALPFDKRSLTLAFNNERTRKRFNNWLSRSKLLTT